MTIGQARGFAFAVSLAYLPACIFGLVIVWVIAMVAAVVLHFGIQIRELHAATELDTLTQTSPASVPRRLYFILFANAFIPTVGIALATVLQAVIGAFPTAHAGASTVDAYIFGVASSIFVASEVYDALSMIAKGALHAFVLSAFLMVALIATKYRALYPLMSRVHCIRARDQVTLESKFAVYLHYKKRLAIEFPLLALLFVIYAVALDYFLGLPVASGITFVALCILLPPYLFIEGFYFLVRTTVYFRHF